MTGCDMGLKEDKFDPMLFVCWTLPVGEHKVFGQCSYTALITARQSCVEASNFTYEKLQYNKGR